MSSKHLVDPELLSLLETFPPMTLTTEALPGVREAMRGMLPPLAPAPPGMAVEELSIPASEGHPLRVLVYRPTGRAAPVPAVLDIHGGGYVVGAPEMDDARNRHLCATLGCAIVSVDYRLAPEAPHPGPVEDCYAALAWMHREGAALGLDPARIAVMGASAGGGLAAALALLARDRGEVPLAGQVLMVPMLDDRTVVRNARDPHPYAGEFIWTQDKNHFGWSSLLGCEPGSPGVSPYAAAARAEDLAGLPPTLITTGALDLFAEENMEYARRLMRAGVATELHVYPGAFHGFQMNPDARVTRAHDRDVDDALRRILGL